jgi:hypothetical protein
VPALADEAHDVGQVIYPGAKDPIQLRADQMGFGKFASGEDQKFQKVIPMDSSHR